MAKFAGDDSVHHSVTLLYLITWERPRHPRNGLLHSWKQLFFFFSLIRKYINAEKCLIRGKKKDKLICSRTLRSHLFRWKISIFN